jgi:aldehyde dehydrogenase (NAD+)
MGWSPGSGPGTASGSCAWAHALRAGQVFVKNYGAGGGIELPFGGMKGSGFGREKGFEALYGFSALKTVAIRHG